MLIFVSESEKERCQRTTCMTVEFCFWDMFLPSGVEIKDGNLRSRCSLGEHPWPDPIAEIQISKAWRPHWAGSLTNAKVSSFVIQGAS